VYHRLLNTDAVFKEPNRSTFNWVLDLMVLVADQEQKNRSKFGNILVII